MAIGPQALVSDDALRGTARALCGQAGEDAARGIATVLRRRGHVDAPVLFSCDTGVDGEVRDALVRGLVLGGSVIEDVSPLSISHLRDAGPDAVCIFVAAEGDAHTVHVIALGTPFGRADFDEVATVIASKRLCAGEGAAFRGSLESALTRIAARLASSFAAEGTDPHQPQADNTEVEA